MAKVFSVKYKREWRLYKEWLVVNLYDADSEDRFLIRENVDVYFSIYVVHNRSGVHNTIKTILYVLRWFSRNREYIIYLFTVDSAIVEKAIENVVDR